MKLKKTKNNGTISSALLTPLTKFIHTEPFRTEQTKVFTSARQRKGTDVLASNYNLTYLIQEGF